jgi:hypothetical protein
MLPAMHPAVLGAILLLLCACEREPTPLPGLSIASDGRIISADLQEIRRRCETEVAERLAAGMGAGARVSLRIAETPFPADDGATGYWTLMTAAVEVAPAPGQEFDAVAFAEQVRQILRERIRGPAIPFVEVTVAPRG